MSDSLPCEGVFAINKPPSLSSAQVIRDAQSAFKSATLFQPWLEREQAKKDADNRNPHKKRRKWKDRQPLQVKMGHGGTLDPMATGVLILGVGKGTKQLNRFLECTKTYETVVLFGVATDSYDSVGRVVSRKSSEHVTRSMVAEALEQFRGKIKQRPPVFSALRVQGKRLYEYAREGKEVPIEIEDRTMEVQNLEMLEWMEGGTHEHHWPAEEAEQETKEIAEKVMDLETVHEAGATDGARDDEVATSNSKRKREESDEHPATADPNDSEPAGRPPSPKRPKSAPEPFTRGHHPVSSPSQNQPPCPAPAARIRMTVTSGFYVRSFCHDLGLAVDSLGLMAALVRTRQGDFELGKNVLEYDELGKGEESWGGKVQGMLRDWQVREGEDGGGRGGGEAPGKRNGKRGGAQTTEMRRNSSSEDA